MVRNVEDDQLRRERFEPFEHGGLNARLGVAIRALEGSSAIQLLRIAVGCKVGNEGAGKHLISGPD